LETTCPLCSSLSSFEAGFSDVQLYRCSQCDHCYTDQSKLKHFEEYSAAYYELHHKNWNLYPDFHLFEAIYNETKPYGPNARILDVGCGKGAFLKYLRSREPGYELTGLDMSSSPPSAGITFVQGDFLSSQLNKDFDVVVSLAVIEHVTDVSVFVDGLYRLSRPGGLVVVMTLDDRSVIYSVSRTLFRWGIKAPFERLYSRHHLHHFNVSSLNRLMKQHQLLVNITIHHNNRLAAVDFSESSFLKRIVFLIGVLVSFLIGKLFNKTLLQTVVCKK